MLMIPEVNMSNVVMSFKNRYGDTMSFEKLDNDRILWSGSIKYARISLDEDNVITMVDPSGGPYIDRGWDMGKDNLGFAGMFVDYFEKHDEGYIIVCNGGEFE